jgi:hypothetical protein
MCNSCYLCYRTEDFFCLACGHRFCLNCNRDHLSTKVQSGIVQNLPCMQFECKELFTAEQISRFCSKEINRKYEVIQVDMKVGTDKNLKWCAKPDCGKAVRKPGFCRCTNRTACECGEATCWKCGNLWHAGACVQSDNEAKFKLYGILHNMAKCPHCGAPSEKEEGCNKMTCYRC